MCERPAFAVAAQVQPLLHIAAYSSALVGKFHVCRRFCFCSQVAPLISVAKIHRCVGARVSLTGKAKNAELSWYPCDTLCRTARHMYSNRRVSSPNKYFSADGAALVYTSAKDGVNCSLLHRYLLSCVYPGAFTPSEEGQVRQNKQTGGGRSVRKRPHGAIPTL